MPNIAVPVMLKKPWDGATEPMSMNGTPRVTSVCGRHVRGRDFLHVCHPRRLLRLGSCSAVICGHPQSFVLFE